MSSAQVNVDDTSSSVSFTGSWTAISHPGAYDNTLHQTTTTGSSYTLSYNGSPSVTLFGSIEPCHPNLDDPTYHITLDGKTGPLMSVPCGPQFQDGLSVTAEADGPSDVNANHVVTFTFLGGSRSAPLMFDYIQYTSFAGGSPNGAVQAPATPPSNGARPATAPSTQAGAPSVTANPTPTSASPLIGVSPTIGSMDSPTQLVGSPAISNSASIKGERVTQLTTINGVVTHIAVISTSTNVPGGSNPSSPSFTGGVKGNRTHLIGPIVGTIIGVLLVGFLMLVFFLRRRRSGRLPIQSPESVEPFNLDHNSSSEHIGWSVNRHSISKGCQLPTTAQPSVEPDLQSPLRLHPRQLSAPTQPPMIALSDATPVYIWASSSTIQHRPGLPFLPTSLDVPPPYNTDQTAQAILPSS
ncbi:hypothetical protein GALMADRAFT_143713 [Galerina marginata CBS 339.88]|uniref:Mid2 domain-containing protein n=1 Tax=Galerina marginata (strain CBS 339.88) TaxID=685588 RepID=A0A067SKP5_GALM3|nr:hypothetical protein GALMADRAFT_143713 [Galerina marginata CBS 339.88]